MIRSKGLTLIELLFCLLIITLLLVSLSFGLSIHQKNKAQIRENDLKMAIYYARNMALLKGKPLVLTPLTDSDWSTGMMLFIDNKTHRYSPETQLIHQWQWHKEIKITWHGFYSDQYLLFSPDLAHAAITGHFNLQKGDGSQVKLIINRLGRVRKAMET
ncbi:GspH/FimT family pseudopilin [Legionella fairfieldensis]|uniref:GspH/FimT family pseudopilin n=1 Tax=Legionella fairfieldensis TaxID=45064 RepID=UPI0006866897|nr:GspH/FimT family pseudopilin [Legionella fairfieldensis]